MHAQQYYDICCQHRGKTVIIKEKCGKQHYGKIVNVDKQYVWIEPVQRGTGFGGYSYGYPGYGGYPGGYYQSGYTVAGYGGYPGYRPIFPVALAAIGGFALGAAFFW
ncbi:hypothetical protein [Bacillus alkalicellulosilyticus]|uniref:hypothetical protein n=1 Tax=Alkalihalobacterium alkalicellulosilyticum TaxID=1912214 RepID=UPI000997FA98|nr:hypothetical protein [Bacillus alkalicellulosilyticus]